MTTNSTTPAIQRAVKRHIRVSVVSAAVVLVLAVFSGLPTGVVVFAALALGAIVGGVAMHGFSERPAVQVLLGFTAFFVFMMLVLFRLGVSDKIPGTERGAFDSTSTIAETH